MTDRFRILPFGGCRINNPFSHAEANDPRIIPPERPWVPAVYTFDEIVQIIDIWNGDVKLPKEIASFMSNWSNRLVARPGMVSEADMVLIETSSETEYKIDGYAVNRAAVSDQILKPIKAISKDAHRHLSKWHNTGLVGFDEEVRAVHSAALLPHITDDVPNAEVLRRFVRDLRSQRADPRAGFREIMSRLSVPIGYVNHVWQYFLDGRLMNWPAGYHEGVEEARAEIGVPLFKPENRVVERGVGFAMRDDLRHYSQEFIPEIAHDLVSFCVDLATEARKAKGISVEADTGAEEAAPVDPGSRTFTLADQLDFAEVVADYNPIHVDPDQARKLIGGGCLVHGIHGLLWALESLPEVDEALAQTRSLVARFQRTITIGLPVTARVASTSDKQWKVEIVGPEGVCTTITLKLGAGVRPPSVAPFVAEPEIVRPAVAVDRDFAALEGIQGRLAYDGVSADGCARLFPKLSRILGPGAVEAVALSSTVVGMEAPGLHSLYSELSVGFVDDPELPQGLSFRVSRLDERYRLITVDLAAPALRGSLSAFVRFPPMVPPSTREIAQRVAPDAFSGRRALVVGGSRGIGAVTAKMIAAAGGRVSVTYVESARQAEELAADIVATMGEGSADVCRYDAVRDDPAVAIGDLDDYDSIYYFATPRIASRASASYNEQAFQEYLSFYVAGFARLVERVTEARGDAGGLVFYPSTIYLEDRPKGMTEYVMAKAAGEMLCADLAKMHPKWTFEMPRIPRVATDQTLTVPPIKSEDPLDAMLRILDIAPVD